MLTVQYSCIYLFILNDKKTLPKSWLKLNQHWRNLAQTSFSFVCICGAGYTLRALLSAFALSAKWNVKTVDAFLYTYKDQELRLMAMPLHLGAWRFIQKPHCGALKSVQMPGTAPKLYFPGNKLQMPYST